MKQRIITSVIALSLLATIPSLGQTTVIKRAKTETERQRQRAAERIWQEKKEAERREAEQIRIEAERKIREEREQFLRDSLAQAEMRALADGDLIILDELEYFYYKDFDKGMWKFHGLRMHFRNDESIEVVGKYGGHAYSYEVIKIPSYVKKKDSDKRYPVTHIAEKTFGGNLSIIEGVILPNTIVEIGDNAFEGCSRTTSIVIPNSVEKIGKHLFAGSFGGVLDKLTFVSIPAHLVSQLGKGTFGSYHYSKVKSINVRYPDGTTKDIPVKEEWK